MNSIDKNDVDISKLFNWGKKVSLFDLDGVHVADVFLRLVGDAELNRSRVAALRASALMRKKLNTVDSDERLAFIPEYSLIDDDNLIEAILSTQVRPMSLDILRNMNFNLPVEPKSNASLEEMEKYQETVDNWPDKRTKELTTEITKRLAQERKRLAKIARPDLEKFFEKLLIDELCEDEMNKVFQEHCVYFGTYSDNNFKNRLFDSYEEFSNLISEIKEQLVKAYQTLDVSLDNLKK